MLTFFKNILCKVKPTAVSLIHSRVLPAIVLCLASVFATAFVGSSVNTVRISDGKDSYTVRTFDGNIESALECAALKSKNYKVMSTKKSGRLTNVEIEYTFPVYVTMGDKTTKITTVSSTVSEILTLAGYTVDEFDMVQPSVDTLVTKTTYIDYSNVDYVSDTYTQSIPCSVDVIYSDKQAKGVTTIQKGTDGLQQINYTTKLVNGVVCEKVVNSTVTLSNAINGKKIIGTAVPKPPAVITSDLVKSISTLKPASPIELDANGNPVNYTKHITVQATGYTYTGNNCSTGVAPQPGYIAVNPKVIPYGTKMYIKSSDGKYIYGYAVAADTGGFIKTRPTNVDLFFTTKSACINFGRRNVEIYILP